MKIIILNLNAQIDQKKQFKPTKEKSSGYHQKKEITPCLWLAYDTIMALVLATNMGGVLHSIQSNSRPMDSLQQRIIVW